VGIVNISGSEVDSGWGRWSREGAIINKRRGNRRTSFPYPSFSVLHTPVGVIEEIPIHFLVHLIFTELQLCTIVGQDGPWGPLVSREEVLVPLHPTCFQIFNQCRICSVPRVALDEECHSQHVAPIGWVSIFPTCFASTLISWLCGGAMSACCWVRSRSSA